MPEALNRIGQLGGSCCRYVNLNLALQKAVAEAGQNGSGVPFAGPDFVIWGPCWGSVVSENLQILQKEPWSVLSHHNIS